MRTAPKRTCSHPGCKNPGMVECEYPLTGRLDGSACGRLVCDEHVQEVDAGSPRWRVCGAHARLVRNSGAVRRSG